MPDCKDVPWAGIVHMLVNHVIEPAPGGATGKVYLIAIGLDGEPGKVEAQGRYEDVYVQDAAGLALQVADARAGGEAGRKCPRSVSRQTGQVPRPCRRGRSPLCRARSARRHAPFLPGGSSASCAVYQTPTDFVQARNGPGSRDTAGLRAQAAQRPARP